MMKARYLATLLLGCPGLVYAQLQAPPPIPTAPQQPAPAPNAAPAAQPATPVSGGAAEPANPRLLGMELPLMDPASDTVAYNGGIYDVGNNAAVRARFEKYLQQTPDDSAESRRYRSIITRILKDTQKASKRNTKYVIGSTTLMKIGHSLYDANEYPGDGGQAGALASAMVSVLEVQRRAAERDQENDQLDKELNELAKKADTLQQTNTRRKDRYAVTLARQVKTMGEKEATRVSNASTNAASLTAAKVNYQSVLLTLLMARRFDHALIGTRVYRHLFNDGNTRLNLDKSSKAYQLFSSGLGTPPTVNTIDIIASNARREVDQNIEAVYSLLAQNKLAQATQRLIEAVAVGEYMQSVATVPVEARQRIARYWTLRKRALTALNARDYGTVEEVAAKMKEMDDDFDDSLLLSYTAGRKRESDLAIRNALKALQANNDEDFNRYMREAGLIWPRNPNLEKGADMIQRYDGGDALKEEFRNLYDAKEYRRIARDRERLKPVAMDPTLAAQYEEVVTLVMKMDGMLEQIRAVAQQDTTIGPCMAYEKVVEWQQEDERYAEDGPMTEARREFETLAYPFVQSLRQAEECEKNHEVGSALACYYRAQCIYPQSTLAKQGIRRMIDLLSQARFK